MSYAGRYGVGSFASLSYIRIYRPVMLVATHRWRKISSDYLLIPSVMSIAHGRRQVRASLSCVREDSASMTVSYRHKLSPRATDIYLPILGFKFLKGRLLTRPNIGRFRIETSQSELS